MAMNRTAKMPCIRWRDLPFHALSHHRLFSRLSPIQTHHHHRIKQQHQRPEDKPQSGELEHPEPVPATPQSLSTWHLPFWTCRETWKRAGVNTLRCLVGCTTGDFSSFWMLQTYFPEIGMGGIMAVSSNLPSLFPFPFPLAKYMPRHKMLTDSIVTSGLTTSLILETVLLHHGRDRLPWAVAVRTALGMSLMSMLAMEVAENVVDYHLTGGVVDVGSLRFWGAAVVSMGSGFLVPLPWNYLRLRRFGTACH